MTPSLEESSGLPHGRAVRASGKAFNIVENLGTLLQCSAGQFTDNKRMAKDLLVKQQVLDDRFPLGDPRSKPKCRLESCGIEGRVTALQVLLGSSEISQAPGLLSDQGLRAPNGLMMFSLDSS